MTLIEIETIEALEREKKTAMLPGAARRNVVTRGVPVNYLVGCLGGTRLCEPCTYLEGLTQHGAQLTVICPRQLRQLECNF